MEKGKLRRSACGQCLPCQRKSNCGMCSSCNKKTLKRKCVQRKCLFLQKAKSGTRYNLTLQLSKSFLKTMAGLKPGQNLDVFDTMFENVSISMDDDKVKVHIKDPNQFIFSDAMNHFFVDIGYNSDESLNNGAIGISSPLLQDEMEIENSETILEEQAEDEHIKTSGDNMHDSRINSDSSDAQEYTNNVENLDMGKLLKTEINEIDENNFKDSLCSDKLTQDGEVSLTVKQEIDNTFNNSITVHNNRDNTDNYYTAGVEDGDSILDDSNDLDSTDFEVYKVIKDANTSSNRRKKFRREKSPCDLERKDTASIGENVHNINENRMEYRIEMEPNFTFKCIGNCKVKVFQSSPLLMKHINLKHGASNDHEKMIQNACAQNKIICAKRDHCRSLKITCPVCKFEYMNTQTGIERHMSYTHKHVKNLSKLYENVREQRQDYYRPLNELVICELCEVNIIKVFYDLHILQEHGDDNLAKQLMEVGYQETAESQVESDTTLSEDLKEKNPCQYCGELYTQQRMVRHYLLCKSNPDYKQYIYCHCGFRCHIDEPERMQKHKEGHKQVEYICELCGKVCKSLSTKFQHRKFAHGIMGKRSTKVQEYECDKCDKVYNLPCRLRRHMKRHSDERNYVCDICGKTYKHAEHLDKHRNSVHFNKFRFYCKKCGHGLNKSKELKSHVCGRVRRRQNVNLNTQEPQ